MTALEHCPVCEGDALAPLGFQSRQRLGEFEIVRCRACSHQFLAAPPSHAELEAFYDSYYAKDTRVGQPGKPGLRDRALVRTLTPRLPADASVLDVGANFGSTLLAFPSGHRLVGIEMSKPAAAAAARSPRLTIHSEPVERAELAEASFDCVLALAVIEHILEPRAFVAKLASLVRPGGIVVMMTGDAGSWRARELGADWHLYHSDGHLHFFTGESFERTLRDQGLHTYDRMWVGPNRLTARLPAKLGRALHCQTTSLTVPGLFARRPEGDHLYLWARRDLSGGCG